ncbi:MAG: fibronectin-binding domain-containing protein [Promethearchaeota archaeon]|nr:MAG: fibronectin-binding domain-containing protein [Candidatus Lokiarchaeota archaeon]
MSKQYRTFSNFDVFTITKELNKILFGGSILNVYEVEDLLILKINTNEGRKNLIIKSDSRINLTDYEYPIPDYPSQYIRSLRKFLRNRQIKSVTQHNFDRIIIIELSSLNSGPWKLIIELFNKGNYLLIDDDNILKVAKRYKKLRNRDLLPGQVFQFPEPRGENFLTINKEEFLGVIKDSSSEIVRVLARNINIAGLYSEELCFCADIEKTIPANELTDENIDKLFNSFKSLRNKLLFGEIKPNVVIDDEENEFAALPFELEIFENYKKIYFSSFNEAVDYYYSKIDYDNIAVPKDQEVSKKIKELEKVLKNQTSYLEELRLKKEKYYELGDFIYAHFKPLENLLRVINDASSKGYSWEEIHDKLIQAKQDLLKGTRFYKKIIPATKQLIINKNDDEIYLDLNKSIGENASRIYNKGKKADKKIKGTINAIAETKEKIKKLLEEKESIEMEIDFLIKKPSKKWYEKYRWFKSSDEFLVIGGRDATSNEIIFKKHLEKNDLVFHTNFPGSPLVVIKNPENRKIPETTLKESADFVASFSRAWKEAWGVVDVYYVNSEQVSKTPPSGEYLSKGSFMISGKKNFIKNAQTKLTIGIKMIELDINNNEMSTFYYPKIIIGPFDAIQNKSNIGLITIIPSKSGLTSGKLAKKIKKYFIENTSEVFKKFVKILSLDEIILALPNGKSTISENHNQRFNQS